jgi:enoyl-CoA hydratase/carnithine racemase
MDNTMETNLIKLDTQDGIAILSLNNGVTNAINDEMVVEIASTLPVITADDGIKGLVVASSNDKFFSIGFDIPKLYYQPKEDFRNFYHSFCDLCIELIKLPKPVVAAINGHAVAGGYILVMCADYRFITSGKKLVGLNEIKLGVPVPYVADCMLRSLSGYRNARQVMDTGEFYPAEDALALGLVDEVFTADGLLPSSLERIRQIADSSLTAFSMIKQNRNEEIVIEALARRDEKEADFIRAWYSVDTRSRLREARKKF